MIAADGDNAAAYLANLAAFQDDLTSLGAEIDSTIDGLDGATLIMPHDSFQYFEVRTGVVPAAFMSDNEDTDPGPGRLSELRDMVTSGDVTCVFHESTADLEWAEVLIAGTDAQTAILDVTDQAGVGYLAMMKTLAQTIKTCAN